MAWHSVQLRRFLVEGPLKHLPRVAWQSKVRGSVVGCFRASGLLLSAFSRRLVWNCICIGDACIGANVPNHSFGNFLPIQRAARLRST